jgi:hypothetical protein
MPGAPAGAFGLNWRTIVPIPPQPVTPARQLSAKGLFGV